MIAPASTHPYDVLLVEDDLADAMLIQDALAERGARHLTQVEDGMAALDHLRDPANPRPDLIVLDLNMPRMNGREFLSIVKEDPELRTIPIVVLTTSSAPDDVAGAYRQHANAYVTKPVNLAEFEEAVRSIDAFYLDVAAKPPRTDRGGRPSPSPPRGSRAQGPHTLRGTSPDMCAGLSRTWGKARHTSHFRSITATLLCSSNRCRPRHTGGESTGI